MLKKIPQTLLLLPLFFSLSLFSSSAIAVCSLVLGENIVVKSLSRDGFAALSPAARTIIAAACAANEEFIFAKNTYECVTSGTGKVWLDRNLGASKVCTARTDTSCFGDYYQWGRNADGHEKFNSDRSPTTIAYDTTDNANFINSRFGDWASGDYDGQQRQARWAALDGSGVCPIGFRVPSATELDNEHRSWSENNTTGAFGSPLKWPAAGHRHFRHDLLRTGLEGYVWSNYVSGGRAHSLFFSNNRDAIFPLNFRENGNSIRCIQGALPAPAAPSIITTTVYGTNTIAVEYNAIAFDIIFYEIYRATTADSATADKIASPLNNAPTTHTDTNLEAGTKYYYWIKACTTADNCSDFSISTSATTKDSAVDIATACINREGFVFAGNGYRCVAGAGDSVWLDRNLGAHRICTAGDDRDCFGDYYQWGRNKDGHQRFNSEISTPTIAYTTTDNANFINSWDNDWALGDDDGLLRQARWAAINGSGVCPIGFRVPSATELDNERRSWQSNNKAGAFASPLKWPAAGERIIQIYSGTGYVWSNFASQGRAYTLSFDYFDSDVSVSHRNFRYYGYSVRCIQGALPAPAAPSTITATAYGANTIIVDLSAIAFDVNFYEVYRSTAAASATADKIASQLNNALPSYADTNLNAGTKYYYWVKACTTADNCSDFSASVSATTEDSNVDIATACAENKAFAFAGNGYRCVAGNGDTVWLDRNLGAQRICATRDDASCYGDYYQWGRNKDGHEKSNADTDRERIAYTTTDNANLILVSTDINGRTDWASDDSDGLLRQRRWAATDGSSICPRGFRVPSASELQAAIAELSPPTSGSYRDSSDIGDAGVLWSNDIDDNDNRKSLGSEFSIDSFDGHNVWNRTRSFPVRCIQD